MAICDSLLVGMAIDALERRVIRRIHMTIGAEAPDAGMPARVYREIGSIVIPGGGCPVRSGVAGFASGREIGGRVNRIGSRIVGRLMT